MAFVNRRLLMAAALVLALPSHAADMKPVLDRVEPFPVAVEAQPIRHFQKTNGSLQRFGKLTFRGGLVLHAPREKHFGGWSGLVIDDKGERFLAVSDSGAWLRGQFDYRDGRLAGVSDAMMGPIRTFSGRAVRRGRDRDAEDVALVSGTPDNGIIQVAFERNARVAVYKTGRNGFSPTQRLLQKPRETPKLSSNSGFEAMTVVKGGPNRGRTVLIAEYLMDKSDNHTGWIYTSKGPRTFAVTKRDEYSITGLASLDDGTLFLLERRFRWLDGVRMRIRRIAAKDVRVGAVVDGDILFDANMSYEIDNMEAIAATRQPDGRVVLTVLSDDNFNQSLQRNLLLQFYVNE